MLTMEQMQEALQKHNGNKTAASKALGMDRTTFKRWLANGTSKLKARKPVMKLSSSIVVVGKSLADFRATHDKNFIIPNRVRDGLKQLGEGKWEYELQFAKLCGVSLSDLGNFRDLFAEYIVVVERTKRVWAGSKSLAEKLREMVR